MIAFPAPMRMFAGLVLALSSMTAAGDSSAIESPCVKICALDPASNVCMGCGRTLAEIARWRDMSGDERSRVMAELPRRIEALRTRFDIAEQA